MMTDAQMYAEALRYMARLPYGDWRRNVDNQWLIDAADCIEQAEIERLRAPK